MHTTLRIDNAWGHDSKLTTYKTPDGYYAEMKLSCCKRGSNSPTYGYLGAYGKTKKAAKSKVSKQVVRMLGAALRGDAVEVGLYSWAKEMGYTKK